MIGDDNLDTRTHNVLSLCAGGGGLDLGVRAAVPTTRTVCYVENEVTACAVLAKGMEAELLDAAPVWTDLKSFDGRPWRGLVDGVIGGYPCQPFSTAGKRRGADDPRHLWPHIEQLLGVVQPEWCFFENVANHLRLGFREVAGSLQDMGYRVAAGLFTAEEIGAPHRRERLFILAYSGGGRRPKPEPFHRCINSQTRSSWCEQADGSAGHGTANELAHTPRLGQRESDDEAGTQPRENTREGTCGRGDCCDEQLVYAESVGRAEGRSEHEVRGGRDAVAGADGTVGDTDSAGSQGRCEPLGERPYELPAWPPGPADADAWRRVLAIRPDLAPAIEPPVRGVADGVAGGDDLGRADRLRILGNGVVPQQAAFAFRTLARDLNWSPLGSA